MSVGISLVGGLQTLVANGKHAIQSGNAVELVNLEAEATSLVVVADARHGIL